MDALKDSSDAEYEKVKTLSESLTQLSSLVMSILGNAPVQTPTSAPAIPEKKGWRDRTKEIWNES
ncbi:MAG: hypothetical protein LBG59_00480, partial [Candidatus Peribacteria bacterium]|jgi:hypothetical protein|nr:hypothetical protein [Candidatus Peribacteria bacterium]